MGSIPGSGRPPGGGNGNPLQYSCLRNSMDRGDGRTTVHGITKRTGYNDQTTTIWHVVTHTWASTHTYMLTFFSPRSDNIIHTVLQLAFYTPHLFRSICGEFKLHLALSACSLKCLYQIILPLEHSCFPHSLSHT